MPLLHLCGFPTESIREPESAPDGVPRASPCVGRREMRCFEVIVDHFWPRTLLYAQHLTADPEQAQDITQEAFVRLWEHRESWMSCTSVQLWLIKVVRNLVISEYRKRKVRSLWASRTEAEQSSPVTPLEHTENIEVLEAIRGALHALSPRRREAFTLFHLQGLSYQELGVIMNVRPQTAANYVQAAITNLRVELARFLPSASAPRRDAVELR